MAVETTSTQTKPACTGRVSKLLIFPWGWGEARAVLVELASAGCHEWAIAKKPNKTAPPDRRNNQKRW